ncbi:MAG: hypothetical protein HY286_06295 [Planctomycetes bacterium]|nr:hypothetical protein [Planctomycetota bacterium]
MSSALRNTLILLAAGIALAFGARKLTPPKPDPRAPVKSLTQPTRDDYEYTIFMKRGAWAVGLRPYLDVFSEYPPLATWSFGIPFFIIKNPEGPPAAALEKVNTASMHSELALAYADVWCVLMCLAWFATAALTALLAESLNLSPGRALLMLGPASLFCALQRFDPLPSLAMTAALYAFVKDRSNAGFALLGAGVMLKIYPLVAFFLALGFVWKSRGARAAISGTLVFVAILILCEAPVFISGWNDPAWMAKHRPASFLGMELTKTPLGSAIAAVDVPFAYQGERDTNAGSFPERLFHAWFNVGTHDNLLFGIKILHILQFAAVIPAFLLGWLRPRAKVLVAATAAMVTAFVLFHNIYSPQFQLWIVPLAAVAAGGRLGLAVCACAFAIDVATYLQFPILAPQAHFDPATQRNIYPAAFLPMVDLRLALTAALLALLSFAALRRPTTPNH